MPNFDKTEDQLENHFDKWLYVFKNLPLCLNLDFHGLPDFFDYLLQSIKF
jgi:hypothetical protein